MTAQVQERGLVQTGPQTVVDVRERDRLLRQLILPKASPEQLSLVLAICQRYSFDPLLRHVLIVGGNLYVTRDGLRHMAWQSGEFDGYDPPEERRDEDGKWVVTVKVWRKGIARPFVATAYQSEAENTASPVWRSHPRLMTGKVAEVIALRMAFGVSLGGAEEIGFDDQIPQTNIGEARFVEQRAREVPPAQLAAPVETMALFTEAEFHNVMLTLERQAADGVATEAITTWLNDQRPRMADEQYRLLANLWKSIKAARKAGEAWPHPDAAADSIEEGQSAAIARSVPVDGDEWAAVVGQPAAPVEVTPLGPADARATERQVKFIVAIGREAQLDEAALGDQSNLLYGCPVDRLNRQQAADLIEKLQLRRTEIAMGGKPASYAG